MQWWRLKLKIIKWVWRQGIPVLIIPGQTVGWAHWQRVSCVPSGGGAGSSNVTLRLGPSTGDTAAPGASTDVLITACSRPLQATVGHWSSSLQHFYPPHLTTPACTACMPWPFLRDIRDSTIISKQLIHWLYVVIISPPSPWTLAATPYEHLRPSAGAFSLCRQPANYWMLKINQIDSYSAWLKASQAVTFLMADDDV